MKIIATYNQFSVKTERESSTTLFETKLFSEFPLSQILLNKLNCTK